MKIQRTVPPTAAPVSCADLIRGLSGLVAENRYRERIEADIRSYFHVKHVFLVSSGKAGLSLILTSLKSLSPRQKVVIPAYTCFSVPSAIVKCGLEIVLCDVDPDTLDFDFSHLEQVLDERTLCVLPTHLFGIPSDVDRVLALARRVGALVVEDAAQAMGGISKGRRLGALGDAGFFSLGRGKNITCGSGGIVLTKSETLAPALRREYSTLPAEPLGHVTRSLASLAAMRVFIQPWLYWFPASLPFLHLGETFFCPEFPEWRLSPVKAALLSRWRERLEWSNQLRRRNAQELAARIASRHAVRPTDPSTWPTHLRFPLMMGTPEAKRELCMISHRKGLGFSPSYPTAIDAIPALAGRFGSSRYPGATTVASRLVTLPVHHLVNRSDVERSAQAARVFSAMVPGPSYNRSDRPAVQLLV